MIEPAIEQIEQVLNEASSITDAIQRLLEIAPHLNMAQLADMLGNARFTARLAGAVDADIGNGNT